MADVSVNQSFEGIRIYGQLDASKKEIRVCHIENELDGDGRVQCRLEVVSLAPARSLKTPETESSPDQERQSGMRELNIRICGVSEGVPIATETAFDKDDLANEEVEPTASRTARSSKPLYKAISWTWGDSSKKAQIVLNDQLFEVPHNAAKLLRDLCFEQQHRQVWLDAICINQADLVERGQQVAIMQYVYASATQVLIWLGEDNERTAEAACTSIDMLVTQCMDLAGGDESMLNDIFFDGNYMRYSHGLLPTCDWSALNSLFSCPWFSRLWVVQEVMLGVSPRCYWGTNSLSWSKISLAAQWLEHRGYHRESYMQRTNNGIDMAARMWRISRLGSSLCMFLRMSVNLDATEPLDKVYGILGLVQEKTSSDKPTLSMIPDYTSDLATVYAQITKAAIDSEPDPSCALWIVENAQAQVPWARNWQEKGYDWPSWVPQYHRRQSMSQGTPQPLGCRGHAADRMPWSPNEWNQISTKVLHVQGILVDRIATHTESLTTETWVHDSPRYRWISKCDRIASELGYQPRAVALTLTSEMTSNLDDAVQSDDHTTQYEEYLTSSENKSFANLTSGAQEYVQAVWLGSGNRAFFASGSGAIGTAPHGVRPDDLLCILFGGEGMFVLRQQGEHYVFIGTAYVHGLMQGQCVRYLRAEGILEEKTQWFEVH